MWNLEWLNAYFQLALTVPPGGWLHPETVIASKLSKLKKNEVFFVDFRSDSTRNQIQVHAVFFEEKRFDCSFSTNTQHGVVIDSEGRKFVMSWEKWLNFISQLVNAANWLQKIGEILGNLDLNASRGEWSTPTLERWPQTICVTIGHLNWLDHIIVISMMTRRGPLHVDSHIESKYLASIFPTPFDGKDAVSFKLEGRPYHNFQEFCLALETRVRQLVL
jgi:hypothetical protein